MKSGYHPRHQTYEIWARIESFQDGSLSGCEQEASVPCMWVPSKGCPSVLTTWQLVPPRESDPRKQNSGHNVYFSTCVLGLCSVASVMSDSEIL